MYTGTNITLRGKFFLILLMLILITVTNSIAQVEWTKYTGNPVLTPGSSGEWDDAGFAGQSVLYNEGIYKMWYGASDGTHFRIGYATSPDGINWKKYDDSLTTDPPYAESDPVLGLGPGSFESQVVYFPTVYYDGTFYSMWYAGTNGYSDRVGYAWSQDGIVWTKDTLDNPVITVGQTGDWDDTAVDPGPVKYNGTNFEMIYNGLHGQVFQGGYATSPDGVVWTKDTLRNPIFPAGSDTSWDYPRANPTSVVYNSYTSKYYLFYSGGVFLYWKIGYATADSFSGPWTKDPSIMLDVTPGGWDSQTAAFPSVLYDPDDAIYKMWYMGAGSLPNLSGGAIGYATAPLVTGITGEQINQLFSYSLCQNYPNPFNPCTKIQFTIPKTSWVQIKVYDVLGNEITTLIEEEKPAGTYDLTWNAAKLPSGIYFYQFRAESFIETKKMILMK